MSYRWTDEEEVDEEMILNDQLDQALDHLSELLFACKAIKGLLGGDYCVCRTDKEDLWISDILEVGNVFEKANVIMKKIEEAYPDELEDRRI